MFKHLFISQHGSLGQDSMCYHSRQYLSVGLGKRFLKKRADLKSIGFNFNLHKQSNGYEQIQAWLSYKACAITLDSICHPSDGKSYSQ
mmetsp:Transcript_14707/g.14140  ORF Transcript_14707/g.14140 Transcript_14707/m.14140 type:complete len:88 (+) Transcript_14707:484-747(+)